MLGVIIEVKPKRLRYLSKGEIIILEYRIDKTFATFMNEVAEEQLKDGDEKYIYSEDQIEERVGYNRKILIKYINQLGMENLYFDSRYKIKNKKSKIFPVHFQVLSRVLLNLERKSKKDFGKKILDNRFSEITKDEIKKFTNELEEEFSNWFVDLVYTSEDGSEKNKEELDEIYLQIEEEMLESKSTQYIDEIKEIAEGKNGEIGEFSKREAEYLYNKFLIRQQQNIFLSSVMNNFYYKKNIASMKEKIHKEIDDVINRKLELKSLSEDIALLEDYESELLGIVPLPQSFIERNRKENKLTNEMRSILLEDLYCDIVKDLEFFCECVDCFLEKNIENPNIKMQYCKVKAELTGEKMYDFLELLN